MSMSKYRKRKPWVVEMQPPHSKLWVVMWTAPDEDEARMRAELTQKRVPEAKVRYRDLRI